jgi:hypothetical protein
MEALAPNDWVSKLLNKENANISSKDVDINKGDSLQTLYGIFTLGGLISW